LSPTPRTCPNLQKPPLMAPKRKKPGDDEGTSRPRQVAPRWLLHPTIVLHHMSPYILTEPRGQRARKRPAGWAGRSLALHRLLLCGSPTYLLTTTSNRTTPSAPLTATHHQERAAQAAGEGDHDEQEEGGRGSRSHRTPGAWSYAHISRWEPQSSNAWMCFASPRRPGPRPLA
jgi:hypothetical protein